MRYVVLGGLSVLLLALYGCMRTYTREDWVIADRIMVANNRRLAKEGLDCFGSTGVVSLGTIGTMSIAFRTEKYKFSSIDDARVFICKLFEDYVRPFNEEKRIRPYLHRFPIDANMLQLSMNFRSVDNYVYPPYLACVNCAGGKIYYSQYDPATDDLVDIYVESFDRAWRIVAGSEEPGGATTLPRDPANPYAEGQVR